MLYQFIRKKIHARQHPKSTDQKRQCPHQWQNQNQESELGPVRLGNEHDPVDAALLSDRYPAPEQIQPNGPCQKCKEEKHDARVYRSKLIAGLVFPYFLASVDLTIVASAMPFIASYFST